MSSDLLPALEHRIAELDFPAIKGEFDRLGEFLAIEDFLPPAWLDTLRGRLPALGPHVHRNFMPQHKKGGSISRFTLDKAAPEFAVLYRAPQMMGFLQRLTAAELIFCPQRDPHTYALYYYTEPGDHIGYHYDTSYYRGVRYTVLFGLVDESRCALECQLFTNDPARETETRAIALAPGMFVIFNGGMLYHRVTPLGLNERRICLTMEYVTSTSMHPFRRFISDMKDSIAYFGFNQVFRRRG